MLKKLKIPFLFSGITLSFLFIVWLSSLVKIHIKLFHPLYDLPFSQKFLPLLFLVFECPFIRFLVHTSSSKLQ